MRDLLQEHLRDHLRLIQVAADELLDAAVAIGDVLSDCFRGGGTLYLFGNGGSAADAQHMAAELINRYRLERPPLPAVALTTDPSVLTSIANDYDFRDIFAKQLRALASPSDVALGITTSGASPNVLAGFKAARQVGCRTVALLGRNGGEARGMAELTYVVPHEDTARIQEVHHLLIHLVCEAVEQNLFRQAGANRAGS